MKRFKSVPEDIENALKAMKDEGISLRKAAAAYGVPVGTLSRKKNLDPEKSRKKAVPDTVFSLKEEGDIVNWMMYREVIGGPATETELLDYVQHYVKTMKINTPFTDDRPSHDWYEGFRTRHPQLSITMPRNLSSSIATDSTAEDSMLHNEHTYSINSSTEDVLILKLKKEDFDRVTQDLLIENNIPGKVFIPGAWQQLVTKLLWDQQKMQHDFLYKENKIYENGIATFFGTCDCGSTITGTIKDYTLNIIPLMCTITPRTGATQCGKRNMEHLMEFGNFCNICFNKEGVRIIERDEDLLHKLVMLIENTMVITAAELYLCLNCCKQLESFSQFKEMCFRNLIDFRLDYFLFKNKLETANDPNMKEKLKNFIKTQVDGTSETLKLDDSEVTIKVESIQVSEKQDQESNYNYDFSSIFHKQEIMEREDIEDCNYNFSTEIHKKEIMECDDNEDYKLHSELDLGISENYTEVPVPVAHIKVESFEDEDVGATQSSSENIFGEPSGICKEEPCLTSTEMMKHEENAWVSTLDENEQPINQEIRETECYVCKKEFANLRNLKDHMRIHTGEKPFNCTDCNKSFNKSSTLKEHQLIHTGNRPYVCKECNKTFSDPSMLNAHERVHAGEKPHVCDICNKAFLYEIGLRRHVLTHSDQKPYTCFTCNKNFKRLQHLKEHERVHTGEKPYTCTICGKNFNSLGNLKTHELVHTGQKPYTCEVCQKSFRQINHLKAHERIHNGEKPYECAVCNERFTQLHTYKVHKLTHTGEKPHTCSLCMKTFRQLSTLKEHERLHTGDKPYSCTICNSTFRRRSELTSHKQKPCLYQVVQDEVTEQSEETWSSIEGSHSESFLSTVETV